MLLFCGLALSGLISFGIAGGLLIVFLLLSVEVYLATYTVGILQISHWGFSPTEARILLAILNVVVYFIPSVRIYGGLYLVFDLVGGVGIVCGVAMLVAAIGRNLRNLRRVDEAGRA